jgi:gamma-glutamylcyclotransferase (GGCT)/AIG2-like uncharacterized protein YtfP
MNNQKHSGVLLFSYGTLQQKKVQMANFGRLLSGRPDALPGYILLPITIHDPSVIELSGKSQHLIAKRSERTADEVAGMVFEISAEELAAADRYEVAEYTRVEVTLKSGVTAWVYVGALPRRSKRLSDKRSRSVQAQDSEARPNTAKD